MFSRSGNMLYSMKFNLRAGASEMINTYDMSTGGFVYIIVVYQLPGSG